MNRRQQKAIQAAIQSCRTWPPGHSDYWLLFSPQELRAVHEGIYTTIPGLTTKEAAAPRFRSSRGATFCPAAAACYAIETTSREVETGALEAMLGFLAHACQLSVEQFLDQLDADPLVLANLLEQTHEL